MKPKKDRTNLTELDSPVEYPKYHGIMTDSRMQGEELEEIYLINHIQKKKAEYSRDYLIIKKDAGYPLSSK